MTADPSGFRLLEQAGLTAPTEGMWHNLGMRVVTAEAGRVEVEADLDVARHGFTTSRGEVVHGGAVATVLDGAMAAAAITVADPEHLVTTADLRVEYFRPARSGRLLASAEVRHRGRRLVYCQAQLRQGDVVVAEARATVAFVSR